MTFVNVLLNRAFDALLAPFSPLSVLGSLALLSLITAVATLLVMHATSNQQAMAALKRQMYADLLEMRLFNDDLWAIGRALGNISRHNIGYLRLALVPAIWTVIPVALVIAQLQSFFGYSGVEVGKTVLVTASLKSDASNTEVTLVVPSEVRLESTPIRFPTLRQVMWRAVADSPGNYILGVKAGETIYEKTLHVSDSFARRSPVRSSGRLIDEMLNPSEAPLPDSAPLDSIGVAYPDRHIEVFGAQMSWMSTYIMMSIGFALAAKRPLTKLLGRLGSNTRRITSVRGGLQ
jgi:hypothetical protein